MRAHHLAEPYPVVHLGDDCREAALRMAQDGRPGLIVIDDAGHPRAVLPASQVLRFLIPSYIQDDPPLARALSEQAADELLASLARMPVSSLLDRASERHILPVVDGDATILETAAVLAQHLSPLVAVVQDGMLLGAITSTRLLGQLLTPGEGSA